MGAGLAVALAGFAAVAAPTHVFAKGRSDGFKDIGFLDGPKGVKYRDIYVGNGAVPESGKFIKVNYQLRLTNEFAGVVVDQGKQYEFPVGVKDARVIEDYWNLAVLGDGSMPPMRVGGAREVVIPSELGYGSSGAGCVPKTGSC